MILTGKLPHPACRPPSPPAQPSPLPLLSFSRPEWMTGFCADSVLRPWTCMTVPHVPPTPPTVSESMFWGLLPEVKAALSGLAMNLSLHCSESTHSAALTLCSALVPFEGNGFWRSPSHLHVGFVGLGIVPADYLQLHFSARPGVGMQQFLLAV